MKKKRAHPSNQDPYNNPHRPDDKSCRNGWKKTKQPKTHFLMKSFNQPKLRKKIASTQNGPKFPSRQNCSSLLVCINVTKYVNEPN